VGQFIIRGDQTPFILGPLPTAFEIANECGYCILNLEEINALTPNAQKVLNSVLDFRARVEVTEAKRVFKLKEGCKLWVTATMNGSSYGGVYDLNEDLKSRFRILPVKYPSNSEEKNLLHAVLGPTLEKMNPNLLKGFLTLAGETRRQTMGYALSPRDLVQIIQDTEMVGLKMALSLASGKFSDQDRNTFNARVVSIFSSADFK
jgi:MoxR-like ATPase